MDWNLILAEATAVADVHDGIVPMNGDSTSEAFVFAHAVQNGGVRTPSGRHGAWTPEEDAFLKANYRTMRPEKVARRLGRSVNGVKIRLKRGLRLPGRTKCWKHPSLCKVGELMGVDQKTVVGWLSYEPLPLSCIVTDVYFGNATNPTRLVPLQTLKRWLINPLSWVCVKVENIRDPKLKRLVQLAQERWGDEWWTTGQAAAYLNCDNKTLTQRIYRGCYTAYRWANWRLLRSEVMASEVTQPGKNGLDWSAEGDAFMVLASAVGLSSAMISRLGVESQPRILHRLRYMENEGLLHEVIFSRDWAELPVLHRVEDGRLLLWADWQMVAHRFPSLQKAVRKLKAGRPLKSFEYDMLMAVLAKWARWFGHMDLYKRFSWPGRWGRCTERVQRSWDEMRERCVDPFAR